MVLKSAHGGGRYKSCGGAELILDQTSAWRDVNETLARAHTHTNANPHFIKRVPSGNTVKQHKFEYVELVHIKRKKINSKYLSQCLKCYAVISYY